jgi:hypothetical protein
MVPRSGYFNFDMETGTINYPNYLIDPTTQHTDPSSLISPSEPTVPPQDNPYFATEQNLAHRPYNHVPWNNDPVEMHLTRASQYPQAPNHRMYSPGVSGIQESFDACWHCVLQRAKCSPGDICGRCHARSQRPNADCSLGCNRMKLVDLSPYFLPALVTQMHEDSNLTHFVTQYIRQWDNVELTVWMTRDQNHMPRIPVKVYEFVPCGDALLVQIQHKIDPTTRKRVAIRKQGPALGMVCINHNEEKKYDKYITDIVDNHLDAFSELCWMEDDNDFQQKLFRLMTGVKPKSDDEAELLRGIFRLIVVTFIM